MTWKRRFFVALAGLTVPVGLMTQGVSLSLIVDKTLTVIGRFLISGSYISVFLLFPVVMYFYLKGKKVRK